MKIGLFGGSFDPIHLGHVYLAKQALDEIGLDEVIFIPAKKQPFKLDRAPADDHHRYAMIEKSIESMEHMSVSSYEIDRDEVSYSYMTLRYFHQLYPDAELYFIMGTDTMLILDKWYEAEEILTSYSFIAGSRPGYKEEELKAQMNHLTELYGNKFYKICNEQVDVSSTEIRQAVKEGKSLSGMVSKEVESYIYEQGLYR